MRVQHSRDGLRWIQSLASSMRWSISLSSALFQCDFWSALDWKRSLRFLPRSTVSRCFFADNDQSDRRMTHPEIFFCGSDSDGSLNPILVASRSLIHPLEIGSSRNTERETEKTESLLSRLSIDIHILFVAAGSLALHSPSSLVAHRSNGNIHQWQQ